MFFSLHTVKLMNRSETQISPCSLRVLMLSWRRNIDVWDVFYKKSSPAWDVLQLCIRLAFSRTGVFVSTSDTWRLVHAPFIYLFTALLRHVWPSMSIVWLSPSQDDDTECVFYTLPEAFFFKWDKYLEVKVLFVFLLDVFMCCSGVHGQIDYIDFVI